MAYIDNTQTKIEINDAIRGNSVSNVAPSKVNETVQLVMNVNPKDYRKANIVKRATSGNVYLTPSNKDFYLTNYSLSTSHTTAGATSCSLLATPFGETTPITITQLLLICTANMDRDGRNETGSFNTPILLARGTNITISSNCTNNNCSIIGYTVEA